MPRHLAIAAVVCAVLLGACSSAGDDDVPAVPPSAAPTASQTSTAPPASTSDVDTAARDRIDAVQDAVTAWASATSIEDAHRAAETALNLVVGPNGPGYGDLDGDGDISGSSEAGLLSGLDDTPLGLAVPLQENTCVRRDVLGSTADAPSAGWAEMQAAIEAWRPDNNTRPSLASHPMRIVGWATFTLASDDLDVANDYAGHAQLHVDTALAALDC